MSSDLIFHVTTSFGLVPLVALSVVAGLGVRLPRAWWWMAFGFAVSWAADAVAALTSPTFVSQLYPVTQAALFVLVLAPKRTMEGIIATLLAAAAVSVAVRGAQGLDVFLHVVAWGTVAVLARGTTPRLRWALGAYFGLGVLAWLGYVLWPGWASWLTYQGTRAVGIGLWCWAAWWATKARRMV